MTPTARTSRVLLYPGSAIRVEGPRADVAWLVQFLGPSFRSRLVGDPDWRVRMVRDDKAFARRKKAGRDPRGRRRPCFFLDACAETLPLWRGPRGTVAVFDGRHGVFAFLRKGRGEVEILAPEGERLPRLALMRIMREHASSRLMGRPGLLLHASSFVVGGKGALVIGAKRSGKTSLLLHALSGGAGSSGPVEWARQVQFLANDRVWLSEGSGGFRARSFPTIASLRLSSLELFPEVARRLSESTYGPARTLRESQLSRASRAKPWNGREFTLSPLQLCRLLDVEAAAQATVGVLLFPRVTGSPGRIRMIPMNPREAADRLGGGLFRAGTPQKAGGLFAAPGFPRRVDEMPTSERIRKIVDQIPCFAVELGFRAYSDGGWLRRLRDTMATGGWKGHV